jgi:zinc/manganese transport system ATP-binding protein
VSAKRMGEEGVLIRLRDAGVVFGARRLWQDLTLEVARSEFLAVLGPNGSGKTTLLRVLLGLQPLAAGTVEIAGQAPHRGDPRLGYVPQQRAFDRDLPMRGRDLVRLGLDGHRAGLPLRRRSVRQTMPTPLSAGSQAASSNACASPRLSWETRWRCSAMNRCSRSTSPTSRR